MREHGWRRAVAVGAFAAAVLAMAVTVGVAPARAQSATGGFWAGKSVKLIIGAGEGGGYDLIGRVVAVHMARHLPGQPKIIPQNMPGAGGVRTTNYLANVAERDGTVFAVVNRGVIYAGVLGSEGVQFKSEKLSWLGSPSKEISLCVVMRGGPVSTIQDALRRETIIGGTSPNDDTVTLTALMNNITGTKFRIVTGYKSGTEVNVAMERGEVHGRCGWSWTSLQAQRPHWIKNKTIHILVSQWFEPHPAFPEVPLAIDMVKNADDRKVMEFVLARQVMGRPFVAPPEVPADRLAAMRAAFLDTMKDPQFVAEMKKQKFDLDPVNGEELQKIIGDLAAVPKDLADRAEQALLAKPDSMKTVR